MTVRELMHELEGCNPDAPVMIAVCKYPEEFAMRRQEGVPDAPWSWMNGTDVEVIPLEDEDISEQEGMIVLCVELTDYSEQRHFAGG